MVLAWSLAIQRGFSPILVRCAPVVAAFLWTARADLDAPLGFAFLGTQGWFALDFEFYLRFLSHSRNPGVSS
jgi:hypothetical protein